MKNRHTVAGNEMTGIRLYAGIGVPVLLNLVALLWRSRRVEKTVGARIDALGARIDSLEKVMNAKFETAHQGLLRVGAVLDAWLKRRMHRLAILIPFAILVLAQETAIRTTVTLQTIPVSVTDASGNPIDGISASDFVLLDNGKPQPVKVDIVESGISPVALVAIVQTSDMSLAAIAKIKKIGSMIPLAVVGANGAAALVTYDDQVKLVQDFTMDADAISEAFSQLKASHAEAGHMLDAVDCALDMFAAQSGGHRRNILIIGESKDRGSKTKLETIMQKLQRTGTTVYSMNYSKLITPFTIKPDEYEPTGDYMQGMIELIRAVKLNTAKTLTEMPGGKRFGFQTKDGLERDLMLLSKDLHSRYLLSFTPAIEQTSTFHKIEVQVKNPPETIVRARNGYWSTSP